ncbi:MAG TPA: redoxin domain-containing protein [Nitrososphaeraceae archaeon]|nr:redoxin domain-containing protein [Nitrososphaeraceae archaeon]
MCNHCPYVKACINDLINLQNSFATSELEVVGINSNDSGYPDEGFDNMVKFAEKYELNFPYLIDDTQREHMEWLARLTHSYLIIRRG